MTVAAEPTLAYDLEERRNGWLFRFPAGDEDALWRGPFPTAEAAGEAVLPFIEEAVAERIKQTLGLT